MTDPIISAQSLSFRYASAVEDALRDISLNLDRGRTLVLLGRSGAGKSTLCRCLNGLIPHEVRGDFSGRVLVGGADTRSASVGALAQTVGLLMQDFSAQLFRPNAELEAAFGPENLGLPRDEIRRRVTWALEAVGLASMERRSPMQMSGGQQQRLAIAGVLALKPEVICLDEAASDLDPAGQRELASLMAHLAGQGHTIVMADHDSERYFEIDDVALLNQGRLVGTGAADAVLGDASRLRALGLECPVRVAVCEARRGTSLCPTTEERRGTGPGTAGRSVGDVLVDLRDVVYSYGPQAALRGLTLQVREGEFLAVVGPNGGGKSTLMKHLMGLLRPHSGEVTVCGLSTSNASVADLAREVGYVAQNPDHQLFGDSAFDDVAFGPRCVGLPADEVAARAEEALSAVGLWERRAEDPITMSKGDRQRVALAGALAQRPRLLLMDEPTTGLDHAESRAVMNLLCSLNAGGATIIVVTHAMWVVAEYAHRVVVLQDGVVHADETPRGLLTNRPLLASHGLAPPEATEFGLQLGYSVLSLEELLECLGGPAP